jgi:HPt (histidine-containing phosphotransfer) domain-containing protein
MEMHGTVEANLVSAIASAKRLRGHPVHADTIAHWSDLLHHALRELATDQSPHRQALMQLVAELEAEVAHRGG